MNPELRRYAWLELGLHRLIAVPLVLAALALLVLASAERPAGVLATGALGVFLALTVGWGTLRAYASVGDEVRDRTWDFQRMAALHPRTLALGKVLGAPLLGWYIGAWSLLVYLVAGALDGQADLAVTAAGVVGMALMLHGLGVALSALTAHTGSPGAGRRWGGIGVLLLLVYLIPALVALGSGEGGRAAGIDWWLLRRLDARSFAALSAVLFAGWALFAAWRAMARELREPAWWWAWPAFALFVAFWWAGFRTPTTPRVHPGDALALAAGILVFAGYLGLTLEPLNPVRLARFSRLAQDPRVPWHQRVPGWAIQAGLALLLALAALAVRATASGPAIAPGVVLALGLMLLRDAAVVSCFALGSRARHPVRLAVFYLALADLLVPALLAGLGARPLAIAVFPLWGFERHPLFAAGVFAVHFALAAAVLAWIWRRRQAAAPA